MMKCLFSPRFLSSALVACFDGDGQVDGQDGQSGQDDGQGAEGSGKPAGKEKIFTQSEVNALMEKHRKGLQSRVNELETLVKTRDPEALESKVNELSLSLKTKDEQAKIEQERIRSAAAQETAKLARERDQYRDQLHQHVINSQLMGAAASGDAFNAEQVVTLLRGYTSLSDDGKVVVKGLHTLEDGSPSSFTPEDAVKWMRDQVDKYGNLFKSNVISGIGGHSTAGGARAGKPVDIASLDAGEYRRMKKENPKALGFK